MFTEINFCNKYRKSLSRQLGALSSDYQGLSQKQKQSLLVNDYGSISAYSEESEQSKM